MVFNKYSVEIYDFQGQKHIFYANIWSNLGQDSQSKK